MAAKNRHKIRFWDDSYVQYGFTKVIGYDKPDNAQCTFVEYHFGQRFLKAFEVEEAQELKHKENADSVETFKAKRACYDMGERPCDRLLPNFSTTPAPSYEVSLIVAVTNK